MAKAPAQQPIIDIPGIDDAKTVEIHSKGKGYGLKCKLFVEGEEVKLDKGRQWMDPSWLGLIVRELDRRNWTYGIETHPNGTATWTWRPPRA